MDPGHLDILREALKILRRKETFERAIGRAVRNKGLDFRTYVEVTSELREQAAGSDLAQAAKRILEEHDKQP